MKEGHRQRSFRQKRTRKHQQQPHANKSDTDNLDKMDIFLERSCQKQIQEEIANLNSTILIKDTEFIVKSLLIKKTTGPTDFTAKFSHIFQGQRIQILHRFFQKRVVNISNSFYEVSINLITKFEDIIKKLQISLMNTNKKFLTKYIQASEIQ